MAGHHFEDIAPEPTEANLYQKVECIYCHVVDERVIPAYNPEDPKPLVQRIGEVRTVPADAGCPVEH